MTKRLVLVAGNIGTGVLQRFRVTLDFAAKQAFLEPRRDLPARFRSSFGFTLRERRGRPAIAKVVPRSPAALARAKRSPSSNGLSGFRASSSHRSWHSSSVDSQRSAGRAGRPPGEGRRKAGKRWRSWKLVSMPWKPWIGATRGWNPR